MQKAPADEFLVREVPAGDADALQRIGRLRTAVWDGEGSLDPAWREVPGGYVWLDDFKQPTFKHRLRLELTPMLTLTALPTPRRKLRRCDYLDADASKR